MVALTPPDVTAVALDRVVNRQRTVPPDCDLVRAARAVGVGFGD
jgi:6-phosphofructokinase 1